MTDTTSPTPVKRLHTHTVVYEDTEDILCAVRAMQGRSTKAIAQELGITESKVQYRIKKAQDSVQTRFRADYRNGTGQVTKDMLKATERVARGFVARKIAVQFEHLKLA